MCEEDSLIKQHKKIIKRGKEEKREEETNLTLGQLCIEVPADHVGQFCVGVARY
jgi:hypothetical protein